MTKKPWYKKWWIWAIAGALVVGAIGVNAPDYETLAAQTTKQTAEPTTEPAPQETEPESTPEPAQETPVEQFTFDTYTIENELYVDVRFEIQDAFTKKGIKRNAQQTTLNALQAAIEKHPDAAHVWIFGEFPTQDEYGNDSMSDILQAVYNRNTIDRINFDNIPLENVFTIRDGGKLHPDLE